MQARRHPLDRASPLRRQPRARPSQRPRRAAHGRTHHERPRPELTAARFTLDDRSARGRRGTRGGGHRRTRRAHRGKGHRRPPCLARHRPTSQPRPRGTTFARRVTASRCSRSRRMCGRDGHRPAERSLIRTSWFASPRAIRRADHLWSHRGCSIRSTASGGVRVGAERGTPARSRSPASPYVSHWFSHLDGQARETPASAAWVVGRLWRRSTSLRRLPMAEGAFACVTGAPRHFGRPRSRCGGGTR